MKGCLGGPQLDRHIGDRGCHWSVFGVCAVVEKEGEGACSLSCGPYGLSLKLLDFFLIQLREQ